jgi:hypothetical protein
MQNEWMASAVNLGGIAEVFLKLLSLYRGKSFFYFAGRHSPEMKRKEFSSHRLMKMCDAYDPTIL